MPTGAGSQGTVVVPFSATPVFDALQGNPFEITLTGNVTSSTFINGVSGQSYTFIIRQDAIGSRTFVWPAIFRGALTISLGALANTASIQTIIFDGVSAYAHGIGIANL